MKKKELEKWVAEVSVKPHARNFHPSKLTEKDVRQIRTLQGKANGVDIGIKYGVSKTTICDIFKGRTWKYIN